MCRWQPQPQRRAGLCVVTPPCICGSASACWVRRAWSLCCSLSLRIRTSIVTGWQLATGRLWGQRVRQAGLLPLQRSRRTAGACPAPHVPAALQRSPLQWCSSVQRMPMSPLHATPGVSTARQIPPLKGAMLLCRGGRSQMTTRKLPLGSHTRSNGAPDGGSRVCAGPEAMI